MLSCVENEKVLLPRGLIQKRVPIYYWIDRESSTHPGIRIRGILHYNQIRLSCHKL